MTKFNNMDKEEFICESYRNRKYTITELQKILKVYPNEIYKILRKNKIELRGCRLDSKIELDICNLYESKKTISEISKILSISESTIGKVIKRNKIITRKEAGRFKRKYELDETIFQKIDTFEKAQFLGLIYSDGSLSKTSKNISIRLREDDVDYLNDWKNKFLKTNKPLYYTFTPKMLSPTNKKTYNRKFGTCILDITSKNIYADAVNLGLCPNKTNADLEFPNIDENMKIAFILGLFEGDGSLSISKKNKCYSFTIACQKNMSIGIKKYFDSIGLFSRIYNRKFIHIIKISRKEHLKKLYYLLYNNAIIYMRRKKDKFEKMLSTF
jgi:hypothetical protein